MMSKEELLLLERSEEMIKAWDNLGKLDFLDWVKKFIESDSVSSANDISLIKNGVLLGRFIIKDTEDISRLRDLTKRLRDLQVERS